MEGLVHRRFSRNSAGRRESGRRGSTTTQCFSIESSLSDTWQIDFDSLDAIYGREQEVRLLSEAFHRVSKLDAPSEVAFVHGVSGTGKSALLRHIEKSVVLTGNGYFCPGKFDQVQGTAKPYSAIVDAVSQLPILKGKNHEELRSLITRNIGSDLHVLANLIPSLIVLTPTTTTSTTTTTTTTVEGNQDDTTGSDDSKKNSPALVNSSSFAFTRFKEVFRNFLRLLGSHEHPLVLFLDDLQWADSASQEIIADLVSDELSKNTLFVGAFRDDGKPVYQRPTVAIAAHDVSLGDLDTASINKMIAEQAQLPPSETEELAELVVQRTGGNIHFVVQFLNMLQREGLLYFSIEKDMFKWDIQQIKAQTKVSVNILDVISFRINVLSESLKQILQWAACLGSTFDIRLLEHIAVEEGVLVQVPNDAAKETENIPEVITCTEAALTSNPNPQGKVFSKLMATAKKERMIERTNSSHFMKFSHDRSQQCFYEMTPPGKEQELLHIKIGLLIWDLCKAKGSENEAMMFMAVNQLNQGSNQLVDVDLKHALAELNLRIGKKAAAKSAYNRAAAYFRKAIDQLDVETRWLCNYELCLELHNSVAEMDYAQGNFNGSNTMVDEVVRCARRLEDKMRAYYVRVESLGVQRKLHQAIDESLAIVRLLGESLPRRPTTIRIVIEFVKTKRLLKGKGGDDFFALPRMTDTNQLAKMRLLGSLSLFFWHADLEAPLAVVFLRMMRITLTHGLCKYSPYAFATYGMLLSSLGLLDESYNYGTLAITMLDKVENARDCEARTRLIVFTFLEHFEKPLPSIVNPLLEGYRSGMRTGEVEFASACLSGYGGLNCMFGMSLESLDVDMRNYFKFFKGYSQDFSGVLLLPWHQMVQNLMGRSANPLELTGSVIVEAAFVEDLANRNNPMALAVLWYVCMILLYLMDEINLAGIEMMRLLKRGKGAEGTHFQCYFLRTYMALVSFGLARRQKRRQHLIRARGIIAELEKLSQKGAVNALIMLLVLKAEEKTFRRVQVAK